MRKVARFSSQLRGFAQVLFLAWFPVFSTDSLGLSSEQFKALSILVSTWSNALGSLLPLFPLEILLLEFLSSCFSLDWLYSDLIVSFYLIAFHHHYHRNFLHFFPYSSPLFWILYLLPSLSTNFGGTHLLVPSWEKRCIFGHLPI